ncbi:MULTISPECIES: GIY-YIG nuclease family protein [Flavobacterium]|uniref:GIY-YIG nuclease family protein n=1 Tax=Flavobacterium TaxID=237 RepID=UPI001FCB66ED|nr:MULTISPECIES: GIY-YIG nuclease family protein [Flavobacterium]UOK43015.1 GIY-YIG nuclease family protein [Flavobacterium enshiense]UOK43016.1 GIY-YIG nuclease family protein [Flavobacterium enshiense]
MHYVYILYSPQKETFYIGETADLDRRLQWHLSKEFKNAHSAIAEDWQLFFKINCKNITQARKIENHIKAMKSKKYIQNLTIYPDITIRLLEKYNQL